ncbi:hypothetical protein [Paraburkholderia sp. BL10I2N1]|uniref:hypothetical protein n=1 Tax=Paraburkholderia sp. BL10I2N1 TaxID=1938796 RepID=UPI0010604256|nr:hypothetical protein [Paraburkholderia sp. BL10I2N1]
MVSSEPVIRRGRHPIRKIVLVDDTTNMIVGGRVPTFECPSESAVERPEMADYDLSSVAHNQRVAGSVCDDGA